MAARKKKSADTEIAGEADPKAKLDVAALLSAAGPVLALLKADLHMRSESLAVRAALEARHARERKAERTGDSFAEWRAHFVDQVAAAWLLSCVFVRTLEDRGLLGHARLAGPGAQDSQRLFFELAPSLTERDYLLTVFRELSRFPSTRALFDGAAGHNPVWLLAPSADAAKALLQLFRTPNADAPAFRFGQPDTRFLGDLYQDLDEGVRKRFALLQTPDFVEEYILDRTLEPAIARFGLDETTLIDPTCGSGHFLLGAFARLFEHRRRAEPDGAERDAVLTALAAVAGADINPYAVAIARLRLTLAALEKAGFSTLASTPELPIRLAVADSLLYNPHLVQQELGMVDGADVEIWLGDAYGLEDPKAAREVLRREYAAVVGNPPYITCKDAALREKYRAAYASAAGKYSLAAPFTERFFQLGRNGGFVGMITANSFMKREFGAKLIEEVLPRWNLTRVENTSGAYIPGHGTPTVLLFGTAEPPQDGSVHAILANRGEPTAPTEPSHGLVWRCIIEHGDDVGFENEYITVARVGRDTLEKHPWSLGGGGASELKELLEERAQCRLRDIVECIGVGGMSNADDIFIKPLGVWTRYALPKGATRVLAIGEDLRDWLHNPTIETYFPYDANLELVEPKGRTLELLWPFKTVLWDRAVFGGGTYRTAGRAWWEWHQLSVDRYRTPLTITFAFVATHNHFVLERCGKVFSRSAPIIKLPERATDDDHLALLAYLNSSTACFFARQILHSKGGQGINEGLKAEEWEQFLEFSGTQLASLPLPQDWQSLAPLGRTLERLAIERAAQLPSETRFQGPDATAYEREMKLENELLERMVAAQEQLDFAVYRLFGFGTDGVDLTARLAPGSRFFEAQMSRDGVRTVWFRRHDYTAPDTSTPALADLDLPADLLIIEKPVHKRRWLRTDWKTRIAGATRAHYLGRIEEGLRSGGTTAKHVRSVLRADDEASMDLAAAVAAEAVPYLAAYRFTGAGLEKHAEWQTTWALQRNEDAGHDVGEIPVPRKYSQKDYGDAAYWSLRGKFDVPKERFISYPGCESDEDGEPVYGWAGWNHLERAQALAALYNDRKDREGWAKERLLPMLAGILELLPWIKQWHNEPNADFDGLKLGDYFEGFLQGQMREHGVTAEDLTNLRPESKSRRKARKS
jgi:hypothetical protein